MKTLRILTTLLVCMGALTARPEAQAPPRSAATQPDVVGLRLGMTTDQAQQALRTYNGGVRIRLVYEALPAPPDTRFVSMLYAGVFGDDRTGTGDEIFKLEFSNPPTQRLMVLSRKQTFPQGHELGTNSTMAAFREKYGQPRFERTTTGLIHWTWASGTSAEQPPDQAPCSVQSGVALSLAPNEVLTPVQSVEKRTFFHAPLCGTTVDVSITGYQQLVTTIATMLIDFPAVVRAREELENMSRRPDTRPIEAEQRGKPKL